MRVCPVCERPLSPRQFRRERWFAGAACLDCLNRQRGLYDLPDADRRALTRLHDHYRVFLKRLRYRGPVTIKVADTRRLWQEQAGLCALSGRPLDLHWDQSETWAVLDMIDDHLGAVPGNVHIIGMPKSVAWGRAQGKGAYRLWKASSEYMYTPATKPDFCQ